MCVCVCDGGFRTMTLMLKTVNAYILPMLAFLRVRPEKGHKQCVI